MDSPSSIQYHNFCNTIAAEADAVVVSVAYGLFPTRHLPACYDDSWTALQWVASHVNRDGPDPWLNNHADFDRLFVAGDSAGGNISHSLAVRVGSIGLRKGVTLVGTIVVHPFFVGTRNGEMWLYMCPRNGGREDPRLKPAKEDLRRLGCERCRRWLLRGVEEKWVERKCGAGWKCRPRPSMAFI